VGCELVLIALLLTAALRLERLGRRGAGVPMTAMAVAAMLSAVSEGCFASYSSPSDMLNALGHVAKILAYAYLTRGLPAGRCASRCRPPAALPMPCRPPATRP
jgi:hypothetical protein